MNRRLIIYLGVALLVGLYLYDSRNSTERILPATVTALEARDDAAGPDTWHLSVQSDAGAVALTPLHSRPNLSPGDATCITEITRPETATEYRWSPSASC